ncbi:MAG TPA: hypothetical protein VH744_04990, partial [Terriglobales bacterium]
ASEDIVLTLPVAAPADESRQLSPSRTKKATAETLPGGLVVYQNGKVIFRQQPSQHLVDARLSPKGTSQSAGTQETAAPSTEKSAAH